MGTRSLTRVFESKTDHKELLCMYRQMDGYPSGHGRELAEYLHGVKIVNGIAGDSRAFNGMACGAAQIVAHFKKEIGGFYIMPAGIKDAGQEYEYHVYGEEGDAECSVTIFEMAARRKKIFEGTASEMMSFCKEKSEA